jgi:3-mercaptopyruvate sulfurtransferase SseA
MNEIPQVQIHEAKKKFDQQQCLFVDIRDPGSYRAAHIPGAVHLHDGNVQQFIEGADKDREVIVYCYHGNSSLGAVQGGEILDPKTGKIYRAKLKLKTEARDSTCADSSDFLSSAEPRFGIANNDTW